jgi:hypothetical protein
MYPKNLRRGIGLAKLREISSNKAAILFSFSLELVSKPHWSLSLEIDDLSGLIGGFNILATTTKNPALTAALTASLEGG